MLFDCTWLNYENIVDAAGMERLRPFPAISSFTDASKYLAAASGVTLLASLRFEFNRKLPLVLFAVSSSFWAASNCLYEQNSSEENRENTQREMELRVENALNSLREEWKKT